MGNEINFFENDDYKLIMNLIDKKMPILRSCDKFNEKYIRLYDAMEEFETTLNESQKEKFNEIFNLVYNTEEYYFAFVYSLGVKYGQDLGKL